jgi:hypothetical protein
MRKLIWKKWAPKILEGEKDYCIYKNEKLT